LAQRFIAIHNQRRNISIDGCLDGIGKIPGNLPTELICDYMNQNFGAKYNTAACYDAIDKNIAPIKSKFPWGYSAPFAMSAMKNMHRSYAAFAIAQGLNLRQTKAFLDMISQKNKGLYDKEHAIDVYKKMIMDKNR
jgi:4-hydroxy 2-oxovalerate aldolase